MGLADAVEFLQHRVVGLAEIGDGGERKVYMGIYQLLAAGDGREVHGRVDDGAEAADVRHETGRVHALAHVVEGFLHVVGVAAGGAHHMRRVVMDVVEIERGLEGGLGRAGEEVQAAVEGEDVVGLFHHGGNRGEAEDIVIALAAGEVHQEGDGILHPGIDIMELDAAGGGELQRVQRRGAVQPGLVDVRDHQQRRLPVLPVQHIVDGGQAHGPDTCQERHLSAVPDLHLMHVGARFRVVIGMHRTDDAGQRLAEGRRVETFSLERQQAPVLHHLAGDDDIGGVTADIRIRIAGGAVDAHRAAGIVHRGLDGKLVAGLEGILPFRAHLDDFAGKLVTDDGRTLGDIVRDAFVGRSLMDGLIRGHTDTVAHHPGEDLIFLQGRKFELLQSQIVLSVKTYCFGFHIFMLTLLVRL